LVELLFNVGDDVVSFRKSADLLCEGGCSQLGWGGAALTCQKAAFSGQFWFTMVDIFGRAAAKADKRTRR
jgi:hypothetical protein